MTCEGVGIAAAGLKAGKSSSFSAAIEDSAGAEIAFHKPAARVIDAGIGLAGERIQIALKQARQDDGGNPKQRIRIPVEAVTEKGPHAEFEFPIGFVPDRAAVGRRKRSAGGGRRVAAAEAIIETEPHDVGVEVGALRHRLRRVDGRDLLRREAAEAYMLIFRPRTPIVVDGVFDAAARGVTGMQPLSAPDCAKR